MEQGRPGKERPFNALFLFFARFLAGAFAGQCRFHAFLFAGLQVKGVALDLLDNVFLLHLALETPQSVFEGLTLLKSYFSQTYTPPDSSGRTG
jgi:hypothetical protein